MVAIDVAMPASCDSCRWLVKGFCAVNALVVPAEGRRSPRCPLREVRRAKAKRVMRSDWPVPEEYVQQRFKENMALDIAKLILDSGAATITSSGGGERCVSYDDGNVTIEPVAGTAELQMEVDVVMPTDAK